MDSRMLQVATKIQIADSREDEAAIDLSAFSIGPRYDMRSSFADEFVAAVGVGLDGEPINFGDECYGVGRRLDRVDFPDRHFLALMRVPKVIGAEFRGDFPTDVNASMMRKLAGVFTRFVEAAIGEQLALWTVEMQERLLLAITENETRDELVIRFDEHGIAR